MCTTPLVLLVASDRHHEATALAEILTDEGIRVMRWRGVTLPPDIIVVDEDAAPLRELPMLVAQLQARFPRAVTVFLTSWCSSEPAVRAVLAPVEGICLEKPIDVDKLVALARMSAATDQRSTAASASARYRRGNSP